MFSRSPKVALLAEGVDRNISFVRTTVKLGSVALLAEGVDRNSYNAEFKDIPNGVALLAEGVDRNIIYLRSVLRWEMSPSSRRAWIEII